jgi:hypothetical protein
LPKTPEMPSVCTPFDRTGSWLPPPDSAGSKLNEKSDFFISWATGDKIAQLSTQEGLGAAVAQVRLRFLRVRQIEKDGEQRARTELRWWVTPQGAPFHLSASEAGIGLPKNAAAYGERDTF